MKKKAWFFVLAILATLYYLSSIPGLRVLPVLSQINAILRTFDMGITRLATAIAARLPSELGHAQTLSSDFYAYAQRNPVIIEFMLRKAAHVFVFFVITIAFFLLLRHYLHKPWQAILASFAAGTLMAFLDEYHQSLVDGRHGTLVDVGIDMIGVLAATFLLIFSFWLTSQYRSSTNKTISS
ncbi:VanZ family protein [Dethiobacter alkaliphilus]|uniref:VanZ family protein n=1 Tax=Dethiobacter alkaliphilus AHT 1 TaxID=555088 RepID=C0GI33_DETAL|nr:VanZ family protein [Dethiobacter alkaliphilus]EEG77107.1 VanZ family protein [Dethiobacter alkaliphilus AHT 1]